MRLVAAAGHGASSATPASRWGSEGAKVVTAVEQVARRVNEHTTGKARVTMTAGGFRVESPGMLNVHTIQLAIERSGARGWTGDVRCADDGNIYVHMRATPLTGNHHPKPERGLDSEGFQRAPLLLVPVERKPGLI